MTQHTIDFVSKFAAEHGQFGRVLEVGSRRVEATYPNLKGYFVADEYIGIDMEGGEGVDIIMNAHEIPDKFEKESFDLVISTDEFEHDDKFWITHENMVWALKPGGWMLIVVPSLHCPEHNHPHDYWRFMPQAMDEFFKGFKNINVETFHTPNATKEYPDAVLGWGQKDG